MAGMIKAHATHRHATAEAVAPGERGNAHAVGRGGVLQNAHGAPQPQLIHSQHPPAVLVHRLAVGARSIQRVVSVHRK